ncbi:MAG: hypothetical protein ABFD50_17910 [Smithella sp.]
MEIEVKLQDTPKSYTATIRRCTGNGLYVHTGMGTSLMENQKVAIIEVPLFKIVKIRVRIIGGTAFHDEVTKKVLNAKAGKDVSEAIKIAEKHVVEYLAHGNHLSQFIQKVYDEGVSDGKNQIRSSLKELMDMK